MKENFALPSITFSFTTNPHHKVQYNAENSHQICPTVMIRNPVPYLTFKPMLAQISNLKSKISKIQDLNSSQRSQRDFDQPTSSTDLLMKETLSTFLSPTEKQEWNQFLTPSLVKSILYNSHKRGKELDKQKSGLQAKLKKELQKKIELEEEYLKLQEIHNRIESEEGEGLKQAYKMYVKRWMKKKIL